MLIENQNQSDLKVGDTVKVRSTGKVGVIVGNENGRWVVEVVKGEKLLLESSVLEKRAVLYG